MLDIRISLNLLMASLFSVLYFILYFKGVDKRKSRVFGIFILNMILWAFGVAMFYSTQNKPTELFWAKFIYMAGGLIPPSFLYYSLIFKTQDVLRKRKIFLIFGPYLILFYLYFFSPFMIKGIIIKNGVKTFDFGSLHLIWEASFGLIFSLSFLKFIELYKVCTGLTKEHIKYVFVGTLIGVILASITNVFMPFFGRCDFVWLGPSLTSSWLFCITYTLLKHKIIDIRLAISNTLIFIFVYLLVLGLPFLLGYKYNLWQLSTWMMFVSASTGPFIAQYLQQKAGDRILQEEKRILDVLKKTSFGLITIRDLRKLLTLVSHVLVGSFRVKITDIYLLDEEKNSYTLRHSFPEKVMGSIFLDDPLINFLAVKKYSIVTEELKLVASGEINESFDANKVVTSLDNLSAEVAIPLMGEKKLLGFIIMGGRPLGLSYSPELINGLSVVGNQMALSLEIIMSIAERDKLLNENFQKSRFESLALLCTSISHQMNNRFASIINVIFEGWETYKEGNYKSLSKEDVISLYEDIGENAGKVIETAQGGAEITRAVLDYSKSKVEFGIVNFNEAVDKSIEFIQLKRSNCKLNVVKDYPDNVLLWAAQAPVHDIISNALDNSWFALNQKIEELNPPAYIPQIQIRGRLNGTMFHFEIEDNGLGIKKENINRVLDPMFTTKSNQDGTGLGTTVMLQFIQKLGGTISYESEYKQWTRVKISLPLAIDDNKNGG